MAVESAGAGSTLREQAVDRRRSLPEFALVLALGFGLYAVMLALEDGLGQTGLFGFEEWLEKAPGDAWWRVLWGVGDITEAQFYKSLPGAVGLIAGAVIADRLDRRRSRLRGFPIAYGTGLFLWILVAATVGLVISVALFGRQLGEGYAPTFVPFVSVPAAVVLVYGRGLRVALTGAVLGALFTFPVSWLVIQGILNPAGLPAVIGNVTGMWVGGIIVFEICRQLPWMALPQDKAVEETPTAPEPPAEPLDARRGWFGRRVLADFSEAQFYGNELASAGLILGTLLSWVLNPMHPAYGSGLLPAILLSQVIASAVGILLYQHGWREHGWYPTFVPVVSVAPATVLIFGGTMQSILAGALLGAAAGAPVAQFIIRTLPNHWQPYIGNTFAMALCTVVIVPMLNYMPGFDPVI